MADSRPPHNRNAFQIAIICALPLESDAVEAMFDDFWEKDDTYGKAGGDSNAYTTGRIGGHNVVLVFMPGMGKGHSASVTASLRSSFEEIRLGLVVGIGGGVPSTPDDGKEILLGDVIISTGIVQYDLARQFSDQAIRKDTLQDNLGRPNVEIRAFLSKVNSRQGRLRLKENMSVYLADLCRKEGFEELKYPGADNDILYPPSYRHKHHNLSACTICARCVNKDDRVCDNALDSSCTELKCDDKKQLSRARLLKARSNVAGDPSVSIELAKAQAPEIHFGLIASGDLVMKSGHHRDEIAAKEKVIAFEMEGAGVWDNIPTIVIKGVCDYADSHKNKKWQRYAASVAAACMKAFLKEWRVADRPLQSA
jgi:nucleoside phosphorylase